jgi:hypothetical protein
MCNAAFASNSGYVNGPHCYVYTCITCHYGLCFESRKIPYIWRFYIYMPEFWWLIFVSQVRHHSNNEVEEQLRAEIQGLKEKLAEKERCLEETARDLANLRYV